MSDYPARPNPPLLMRFRVSARPVWTAFGLVYGAGEWALFTHKVRPSAIGIIATVLVSLAIALCARYLVPAYAVALAVALLAPADASLGWAALLPLSCSLFLIAAKGPRNVAMTLLAVSMSAAAATGLPDFGHAGAVGPFALFLITTWFVGYAVGQHRRYTADVLRHHARQADIEIERARRNVTIERMRIAGELHDVVAHSMSVITVQAAYGHLVIDDQPALARDALHSIETVGRQTLTEMRQLLGVLRSDDSVAAQPPLALAPAPGLRDIPSLVERTSAAGLQVELTVAGAARELPAGIDLSVFRIVQEALTNVVKHAGVGTADVKIDYRADELVVEVVDRGVGCPHGRHDGHGLVGMRERVAVYNGVFSAGPRPGGGFRVVARLPLESDR